MKILAVSGTVVIVALAAVYAWMKQAPRHDAAGFIMSAPAQGQVGRIGPDLTVRSIAPDAFVVTHEPAFSSNVLVVRMANGAVVICSSPLDTGSTRAVIRWIREVLAPSRMVAVNPHYHPDGTAGNEAYVREGVETHATGLTQRLLARHGTRIRGEAAAMLEPALADRVRRTEVTPAARTFEGPGPHALVFGDEEVRVIHPGPAHSPDNVVVLFPSRGILFGGCMIKAGSSIGNLADADLDNWEEAVRRVEPLGARLVIPGHGPVGGPELFQNTIDLVRAARR